MKRRVIITYECGGPEDLFKDKEEIGEERYEELTALCPKGLACDGGGTPGEWCRGACH